MKKFIIISKDPRSNKVYTSEVDAPSSSVAKLEFESNYPHLIVQRVEIKNNPLLQNLVNWMDEYFGHDLTNIVVNGTIINRGVTLAFTAGGLKNFQHLKTPIIILLQAGFSHDFRSKNWSDVFLNATATHVVSQFASLDIAHLPEAKSAVAAAINHISDQLKK